MLRRVFYSFHYVPDNWRAAMVRSMGMVDGNEPAKDNDWESITRGGEPEVKKWIDQQLTGRSCTVVLVGAATANRKWIDYEIIESWNAGKGVVAVDIDRLKDKNQLQAPRGSNPFDYISLRKGALKLSAVAKRYGSPYTDSQQSYAHIKANLAAWIDEAVAIRSAWTG